MLNRNTHRLFEFVREVEEFSRKVRKDYPQRLRISFSYRGKLAKVYLSVVLFLYSLRLSLFLGRPHGLYGMSDICNILGCVIIWFKRSTFLSIFQVPVEQTA